MSTLLTCTEPGSVPGQNYVDLEAVVCWLNWDWKDPPVNWVPADKDSERGTERRQINTLVDMVYILIYIYLRTFFVDRWQKYKYTSSSLSSE